MAGRVAYLARTATIWAEIGKRENYRAEPAEDGSKVLIHMDNPKAQGPDIDAINQRQAEMAEHYGLLNWVREFFEKGKLGEHLTLGQVIEGAKQLDAEALFQEAQSHVSSAYQQQGAVAGVAAVLLCLGQATQADFEWAADVCLRAWKTPEAESELFVRGSILLHHPVLYAIRGLGALLGHESKRQEVLKALVQLVAHPYEQIMSEALGAMLQVWTELPEVAWLAFGLAISLSIFERLPYGAMPEEHEANRVRQVTAAVQTALDKIGAAEESPLAPLKMPAAWVHVSNGPQIKRRRRGRDVEIEWEHPSTDFDAKLFAKVLANIPVSAVMADAARCDLFLSYCDDLVQWTIERLYPSWSRKPEGEPFEAKSTELFEWRRVLFRFLARVSLHLDPSVSIHRFVEPIVNTNDEIFGSLAAYFVTFLTCNMMDEPRISPRSLTILEVIVSRMLTSDSWKRAAWNGGSLHDAELSEMIRSVFFVDVNQAMGATRFANGNWDDVAAILPLTEPILVAYGENPTVASTFLTRCERAFEAYPLDQFVTELSLVLRRNDGMPIGWHGTSLPARLAGLVQRFAEKAQPLPIDTARMLLGALDTLVDIGDRRAAAVQTSEVFKDVRTG